MPFLDTEKQRAAILISALGVFLVVALWPFGSGLLGAPVLYVIFGPLHRRLCARLPRTVAALIVLVLGLLVVVGPVVSIVTLIATEGPGMAQELAQSPIIDRVRELRVGPYLVGEQVSIHLKELTTQVVTWLGQSALTLVGSLTRMLLQFTVAFFGFYYLLVAPSGTWRVVRPFIPFSSDHADALRKRFRNVTISTLIGTFLTAAVQGALVGAGFAVAGLDNPMFWGAVTVLFAVLPVVGSGLVWAPGVAVLLLQGRYGAAVGLAAWCLLVVSNVDNLIRPWVFRRYAQIHPFVTVIGAFAGIKYFGLLGLLVGPLAISYFFELIRMYREEYLAHLVVEPPEDPAPPRGRGSGSGRRAPEP